MRHIHTFALDSLIYHMLRFAQITRRRRISNARVWLDFKS